MLIFAIPFLLSSFLTMSSIVVPTQLATVSDQPAIDPTVPMHVLAINLTSYGETLP